MKKIFLIILSLILTISCTSTLKGTYALKNDSDFIIRFEDNKFSGQSYVNNFFGSYSIEKSRLNIKGIGATRMAGSKKYMDLENKFFKDLENNIKYEIKEDTLIITAKDNTEYVFVKIIELNNKEFYLKDNPKITIGFADNSIYGTSIVNNYFAEYSLDKNKFEIGIIGTTLMSGSEEDMKKETEYLEKLSMIKKIYLKDNELILTGDGIKLEFILKK